MARVEGLQINTICYFDQKGRQMNCIYFMYLENWQKLVINCSWCFLISGIIVLRLLEAELICGPEDLLMWRIALIRCGAILHMWGVHTACSVNRYKSAVYSPLCAFTKGWKKILWGTFSPQGMNLSRTYRSPVAKKQAAEYRWIVISCPVCRSSSDE